MVDPGCPVDSVGVRGRWSPGSERFPLPCAPVPPRTCFERGRTVIWYLVWFSSCFIGVKEETEDIVADQGGAWHCLIPLWRPDQDQLDFEKPAKGFAFFSFP